MRSFILLGLVLGALSGCAALEPLPSAESPPVAIYSDNPLLMPVREPARLWEAITDVVEDYFRIESEEPLKMVGNTLTEGRLDTLPQVGSTLLEPWRHDSADQYEKLESTLQSIRRYAHVRATPCDGGFLVDVAVYKELEDVKNPSNVPAGAATFHPAITLTRVVGPIGEQAVTKGWIPLGRDRALEQRILAHLQERLGVRGLPPTPPGVPAPQPAVPAQPSGPSCQPGPLPSQPSPPSTAPRCGFRARDPDDLPLQRAVFRLEIPEDLFHPVGRQLEYSDGLGVTGLAPDAPEPLSVQVPGVESDGVGAADACGPQAGPGYEGVSPLDAAPEDEPIGGRWLRTWRPGLGRLLSDVKSDYSQFYSLPNLALLAPVVAMGGVFANTSVDEHFRVWHDEHVYSHDASRLAYFVAPFGVGQYMVPLFALCTLAQPEYEPDSLNWMVAEWGRRSLRSWLVGGPLVLAMQYGLGGARPEENLPNGSFWTPFRFHAGHAVSGDAFNGGVVFLNAAEMTDNVALKSAFYLASALPAWSRVAHDRHYLSQVIMGWWIAYLSTRSVSLTDASRPSKVMLAPVMMDGGGFGIGLLGTW